MRFFSILLAGDGRAPGVTLFLTPKGKVACHEVGARGEREGDVLRVFNSVAEAAASGRYRKGLMEQAYAEAEAVGQQEVEIDDDLRCQLARAQDAELLDV